MYRFNQELVKKMLAIRIPRWDELPNFEVSNGQITSIVGQTLEGLMAEEDRSVTRRMIKKTLKWDRLPKPEKRKYKRVHIACCMVMGILKPVLDSKVVYKEIELQAKHMGSQGAYDAFCEALEAAIRVSFEPLCSEKEPYTWEGFEVKASAVAINSACRSLCHKIIAEMALRQGTSPEEEIEETAIYLAGG